MKSKIRTEINLVSPKEIIKINSQSCTIHSVREDKTIYCTVIARDIIPVIAVVKSDE